MKWIFRYLKGTSKLCLMYGGSKLELIGFANSDVAGDLDNKKIYFQIYVYLCWGSCLMAIKTL